MFKIKNICTKLTALLLIINLVLLGPWGYVLAQEASPDPSPEATATSENTNTGSDSGNTSTTTVDQTSTTTNTNDSTTANTTDAASATGDNTASDNTGDATITTSDSSTTTDTQTTANTTEVIYEPMPWTTWTGKGDWQTRAQNSDTGSSSTNTATTTVNQNDTITNTNDATITNNTDASSSTGSNTASDNTGNATITTGNASTTTSTENIANTNYVGWTGEGDWTNLWNGEALNRMTGSNSTNESVSEFNAILDVLNQNGVDVTNLIDSFSSTGANTASDNTGSATITTGDASVLTTLFNMANTNIFGTNSVDILYQDIYGTYIGNINLSSAESYSLPELSQNSLTLTSTNQQTGFSSENNATVNGSFTLDILNDNKGILANNLDLEAITGSNTASDNTGNATVTTGDADIIANLINMLNTNIFTAELYLGVVNVFGSWSGDLILPEYEYVGKTSQTQAIASNTFTGSGSENNATTDISKIANLTNNNEAAVTNNFDIALETGVNSSSDNTLSGSVSTGNASGEANLATWSNTNVISNDPWWLVIVNNLGTWIPILYSPTTSGYVQIVLDLDDLDTGYSGGSSSPQVSAENTLTGTASENNASTTLTTQSDITNDNTGTIVNNITTSAVTGQNSADRNTGSAQVTTGDASTLVNVMNFLNTNIVAPSVLITAINVFGSWVGDILGFGTEAEASEGQAENQPDNFANNSSNNQNTSSLPQGDTGSSGNSNQNTNNNSTQNSSPQNNSSSNNQTNTSGSSGQSDNSKEDENSQQEPDVPDEENEGSVLAFFEESDGGTSNPTQTSAQTNTNHFNAWIIALGALPLLLALYILREKRRMHNLVSK